MKNPTENRFKVIAKGHYKLDDGRELKFVLIPGENNSWELERKTIVLSPVEERKAKAHGYNLENVLVVKTALLKRMSPTAIEKEKKISRTSVYKYKKILSEIDTKTQEKHSKNTVKVKTVFPIAFIFMSIDGDFTFTLLLVLVPVFVLAIGAYIRKEWGLFKEARAEHREETAKLHFQFTKVWDLSFCRYPIICNSEKEVAYYKKLLTNYNNVGRTVVAIERTPYQLPNQHWEQKEEFRRQYSTANRFEIYMAEEESSEKWKELEENGLLDFLYFPKRENWKTSKSYLYNAINFLVENPAPKVGDQSRKKLLMDLVPKYKTENKHGRIDNRSSEGIRV